MPALTTTIGRLLVGSYLAVLVYGGVLTLSISYFHRHAKSDSISIRLSVSILLILATLHAITTGGWLYEDLIIRFGNLDVIDRLPSIAVAQLYATVILIFCAHLFFVLRIWFLSKKNWWMTVIPGVLVVALLGWSIYIVDFIRRASTSQGTTKTMDHAIAISCYVLLMVTDVVITSELCYLLRSFHFARARWAGFKRFGAGASFGSAEADDFSNIPASLYASPSRHLSLHVSFFTRLHRQIHAPNNPFRLLSRSSARRLHRRTPQVYTFSEALGGFGSGTRSSAGGGSVGSTSTGRTSTSISTSTFVGSAASAPTTCSDGHGHGYSYGYNPKHSLNMKSKSQSHIYSPGLASDIQNSVQNATRHIGFARASTNANADYPHPTSPPHLHIHSHPYPHPPSHPLSSLPPYGSRANFGGVGVGVSTDPGPGLGPGVISDIRTPEPSSLPLTNMPRQKAKARIKALRNLEGSGTGLGTSLGSGSPSQSTTFSESRQDLVGHGHHGQGQGYGYRWEREDELGSGLGAGFGFNFGGQTHAAVPGPSLGQNGHWQDGGVDVDIEFGHAPHAHILSLPLPEEEEAEKDGKDEVEQRIEYAYAY
ncbi:hypothetical protein D9758_006616 [Tetrapyrgos nigripes]|uniref:Uncharacterized protein n=1 Tax=Tetrapyrgos nigripes TaxID=182062 RepID=A0A8H5GJP5_9AGAR|nr:hypothetical protein D9758_006616 [Tetrapyrgos nigripes]